MGYGVRYCNYCLCQEETAGRDVWWLTENERATTEIDPEHPLFTGGPLFASEDPIEEEEIDDVLYGEGD